MSRVPVAHDDKVLVLCGRNSEFEKRFDIHLEETETPEGNWADIYVDRETDDYWADWVVLHEDLGWFGKWDLDQNLPAVRKITEDFSDWRSGLIYFAAEVDKNTMDIHFFKYKLFVFDGDVIMHPQTKLTDDELVSLLPMDEILEEVRLNM